MAGSGLPFARNANGAHAVDAVSLNRIPSARAVRVGRHWMDARSLRALLAANPRATNPLTRQPFPAHVLRAYGRPSPPSSPSSVFYDAESGSDTDDPEVWL